MCGLTVHMFANLKQVIPKQTPRSTTIKFSENAKYFMYAKQGCGYSKRAYREISGRLKDPARFTIVDPLKKGYLCSATWELKTKDHKDVNTKEKMQLHHLLELDHQPKLSLVSYVCLDEVSLNLLVVFSSHGHV